MVPGQLITAETTIRWAYTTDVTHSGRLQRSVRQQVGTCLQSLSIEAIITFGRSDDRTDLSADPQSHAQCIDTTQAPLTKFPACNHMLSATDESGDAFSRPQSVYSNRIFDYQREGGDHHPCPRRCATNVLRTEVDSKHSVIPRLKFHLGVACQDCDVAGASPIAQRKKPLVTKGYSVGIPSPSWRRCLGLIRSFFASDGCCDLSAM